jgi:hypothetical protein
MSDVTRRNFLKRSLAGGAVLALPGSLDAASYSRVRGANDNIRVAIIGLRGKGQSHISDFSKLAGVQVAALCDVDREILSERAKEFTGYKSNVDTHVDARDVLDRKDIDAIVIATPHHWHSLLTVWGCQAGKDVYVEKPISHSIWEGRKAVEAARKYKRIVQGGMQRRSDVGLARVLAYIDEGHIGKLQLARGLCYKQRGSIGKVDGPVPVPESVDYDLWSGPAAMEPLMRKNLHYDWHWVWHTGNGDVGNQGVHEMDTCYRATGQSGLPSRVLSVGGRLGYIDDGQTANTQLVFFDYKPVPIIFEVRGLPMAKDNPAMPAYKGGTRVGEVFHCEGGYYAGGAGGGWVYDNNDKKIKQFICDAGEHHASNFIEAVRSRKVEDLNADILKGHNSAALCHMGNISYRLGEQASPEHIKEALQADRNAVEAFERFESHIVANGVDLKQTPVMLGLSLQMNPETERFEGAFSEKANELVKDNYREPFVVPEQV